MQLNPALKQWWTVIRNAATGWSDDNASLLAAALSFYTFFSLAPLLLIAISIAGLIFGEEAVRGQVMGQITGMVGQEGARVVQNLLVHVSKPSSSLLATVIGVGTLIVGASAVFQQIQSALNMIWKVPPQQSSAGGIKGFLKKRLLSFGIVISSGFLLLVSLLASALIAALNRSLDRLLPGLGIVGMLLEIVVSFGIIVVVFAGIFKFLPDTAIPWGDVWRGAVVTAALFVVGKVLIGLYLGKSALSSTYGAAASVVIILLWIYYSSQILFFGAEFTKSYAEACGSRSAGNRGTAGAKVLPRTEQGGENANRMEENQKIVHAYP